MIQAPTNMNPAIAIRQFANGTIATEMRINGRAYLHVEILDTFSFYDQYIAYNFMHEFRHGHLIHPWGGYTIIFMYNGFDVSLVFNTEGLEETNFYRMLNQALGIQSRIYNRPTFEAPIPIRRQLTPEVIDLTQDEDEEEDTVELDLDDISAITDMEDLFDLITEL